MTRPGIKTWVSQIIGEHSTHRTYVPVDKNKAGDLRRVQPEGSFFDSYYTEV